MAAGIAGWLAFQPEASWALGSTSKSGTWDLASQAQCPALIWAP